MIFLRKLLAQVHHQLKDMTTSQRLVFGLLASLMVVATVWLTQWSGRTEYIPLLDQPFAPEELTAIRAKFDSWGTDYRPKDEQILVKATEQRSLLSRLSEAQALPREAWIGFKNLMEQDSPFQTNDQVQRGWTVALGYELGMQLTQWSNIKKATVFVVPEGRKRFGSARHNATASVQVAFTSGYKPDRGCVEAIGWAVARAIRGCSPTDVNIVDTVDGRRLRVPDENDRLSGDILAKRAEYERHIETQIHELVHIPGLLVQVNVDLMTEDKTEQTTRVEEPELMSSEKKTEAMERTKTSKEPGAKPNTGAAVAGANGPSDRTTKTTALERFAPSNNRHVETIVHRPGSKINWISATVNVPRSYFVKIFQRIKGGDEEKVPTEAELQPIIDAELKSIEEKVKPLVKAEQESVVQVGSYYDDIVLATAETADADEQAMGVTIKRLVSGNVKLVALGSLAVVSLLMMLMLARKSGVAVRPEAHIQVEKDNETAERIAELERQRDEIPTVTAESDVLTGIEVDSDRMRTQQLIEQVEEMVQADPEMAANLITKWLIEGN